MSVCKCGHEDWTHAFGPCKALHWNRCPCQAFEYERETTRDLQQMLEGVVEFAYEHGYHEHGIPLVEAFRAGVNADALQPTLDRALPRAWPWTTCTICGAAVGGTSEHWSWCSQAAKP